MSYFTQYWKNTTWDRKSEDAALGQNKLDYAASNKFEAAGVTRGATVIIITVKKGVMFVAGRIRVAEIISERSAAASALGRPEIEVWEASQYIIPSASDIDFFRSNISIRPPIAASLKFESKIHISRPKVLSSGLLDKQALRNVRRLYPGAEGPLLAAIGL